jgi:uncharacterized membrane protein YgcG
MSDQSPTPVAEAPAVNPAIANATQALAIKELGETVAGVKSSLKKLWISFAVLAVVTVILAVMTLVPSLRFGMMGNRGTFQRGQFGTGGTFQAPGGGAPGGAPGGGATDGTGGNGTPAAP